MCVCVYIYIYTHTHIHTHIDIYIYVCLYMGFPGDAVVKNPSTSAGNMGSISGLGRSAG